MIREFIEILSELDDGEVTRQLTDELPRMIAAVMATGKAGALTLKIAAKRDGGMAVIKASTTTKIPQAETNSTMFFSDTEGGLHREDPRQLTLRHVEVTPPALRAVKEPTNG